jgi:hypothetical protein
MGHPGRPAGRRRRLFERAGVVGVTAGTSEPPSIEGYREIMDGPAGFMHKPLPLLPMNRPNTDTSLDLAPPR